MTDDIQQVEKRDSLVDNDDDDDGAALDSGVPVAAAAADPVEEDEDCDHDTDTLGNDSDSSSTGASEADKGGKIRKQRKQRMKSPETTSLFVRSGYFFLLHMLCLSVYLIPILSTSEYNKGDPVLDELHITQESNRDVNGETTLLNIFTNDYWGRPMQSTSRYVAVLHVLHDRSYSDSGLFLVSVFKSNL
jgi:hypothetical protein